MVSGVEFDALHYFILIYFAGMLLVSSLKLYMLCVALIVMCYALGEGGRGGRGSTRINCLNIKSMDFVRLDACVGRIEGN